MANFENHIKTCRTCAWFCHTDDKCYANHAILFGKELGVALEVRTVCDNYSFDGLEDWEREPEKTLVTMR